MQRHLHAVTRPAVAQRPAKVVQLEVRRRLHLERARPKPRKRARPGA